ncbi:hypothetical protein [Achromobacter insolitus]|uniref:hypothetical protein n=1 Tax=Achromobacter insolitus TaxID=217204 RepID=UPI001EED553B|nr:hypothetical protein [Achromobacter insolitus]
MNADEIGRTLRVQLETLNRDEQAARAGGNKKLADQCATMRRKLERTLAELPGRMEAADARNDEMLRDLLTELERRLAGRGAASPDGGAQ